MSLVFAFSMVQKSYRASAAFITLSVIFIYAIIEPNVLKVIQFRVIDTAIGTALSYLAMRFLLPAWSFMDIGLAIKEGLKANIYTNTKKPDYTFRLSLSDALFSNIQTQSQWAIDNQLVPKENRVDFRQVIDRQLLETFNNKEAGW